MSNSLKTTFKKVKFSNQKRCLPLKAAKRGYEKACDYLDLWKKITLIQHRALSCLSKTLALILQGNFYSMGNSGLLRHEAVVTLLHPHLGEIRQELRNPPLFSHNWSRKVKTSLKFLKRHLQNSQGFGPYQSKPFRGPTTKRLLQETPLWGSIPLRAVINRFPLTRENQTSEAPGVIFDAIIGEEGVKPPSPITPPKPPSVHQ